MRCCNVLALSALCEIFVAGRLVRRMGELQKKRRKTCCRSWVTGICIACTVALNHVQNPKRDLLRFGLHDF